MHCNPCQGTCTPVEIAAAPPPKPAPDSVNPGQFKEVGLSGVPVMQAALLPNGKVLFLDKLENYTEMKLKNGRYAFSSEYDPITNQKVALADEVCHTQCHNCLEESS